MLAGGGWRAVAHAAKSGFETAIRLTGRTTRFEVEALDSNGRVQMLLGRKSEDEIHVLGFPMDR